MIVIQIVHDSKISDYMKIFAKTLFFIFVLLSGYLGCSGKTFSIKDISYLPADRAATDSVSMVRDSNGDICALVKLSFPRVEESVLSGDQIYRKEYHGNEWYVYMPPESFLFFIKYPGYEDLRVDLSEKFPDGVESGKTYKVDVLYDENEVKSILTPIFDTSVKMDRSQLDSVINHMGLSESIYIESRQSSMIRKSSIYFQAGYSFLGLSALNIGVGGYISGVNIEANFLMGFAKSDEIFWNDTSGEAMPVKATYSPMAMDFKAGYGVIIGRRFRLTPRVGIQYCILRESSDRKVANNANAMSLPIGVKAEFAIVRHFAVSIEPSYTVCLSKSEGYSLLSDISGKVRGYSEGFGLNVSLNLNF